MAERFALVNLTDVADELARCGKCGFCQAVCPLYQATGVESSVARGRNVVVRKAMSDDLDLTKQTELLLFECLLCKACVEVCFSAVKSDEIIIAARNAYVEQHGQPALRRFIFRNLLQDPGALSAYIRLMARGKQTGLSKAASVLSVFGWLRDAANADRLLETIPTRFLRERLEGETGESGSTETVGYFVGCGINYGLPEVGEATWRVLRRTGYKVQLLENYCCGLPPYVYGDLDAARSLAMRNLDLLADLEVEEIVTDCSSCASFLKKYPDLFARDPQHYERADRLAKKVRDINEVLASHQLPEPSGLPATVTFHDPCHLSRYQDLTEAPRRILRSVPGARFVELAEAAWCCGGAGSFNVSHHDLSIKVLDRKMENIAKTSADIVATSCPSCIIQLRSGVRQLGLAAEVLHITQVLDRAHRA